MKKRKAKADTVNSKIHLHPNFVAGEVNPYLFGSFIEHLGRAVYGGIYEPNHPQADGNGFRQDVLKLIGELGVPMVRYPGGNFVSGYRWEDGVGPIEDRPRRIEPAWRTIETNEFGTNEFMHWCRVAGIEPMMAVNLGTRGMDAARSLLEYCNVEKGTYWSDLRRSHGVRDPHNIRFWCLGNEVDGTWQMGHKTAREYGRLACETGRLMKMIDPDIRLIVCGSSHMDMDTFPHWDAEVLEHTYSIADYISLHLYLGKGHRPNGGKGEWTVRDWNDYLATPIIMERQIQEIIRTADHVKARLRSPKTINLSFDEWNVWYHSMDPEAPVHKDWSIAPNQLEDVYTFEDALVFGGMMLSLLRNAGRVHLACLAQLVNVIAPIMTRTGGPAWAQTIFWPFLHGSRYGRGQSLQLSVESPTIETKEFGPVPSIDAAVIHNVAEGELTIFAINRHRREPQALEVELGAFGGKSKVIEHHELADYRPNDRNTLRQPEKVVPKKQSGTSIRNGKLSASLACASWNVVRVKVK